MTTRLRTIPGFENYLVDATGRVFSVRTGELKELPTRTDEFGKKRVSLCQGKKVRTLLVSTLIELSQQNLGWSKDELSAVKSENGLDSQQNDLVLELVEK